ncbi:helix-turn-helix domain-containing protein [Nocardia sp. CDC159]|uniref:Helix-turn-helix domain-containing protein n=1 Tax=Nocardia pulmonis TaxID=2951408 RepID=A0A9X2E4E7_9NOCA|nr:MULTISPECIES: helix-turn-helix domain-containing protein [Nocardia]MCM6774044.1 helix-turn-helix domain-containing protein [Nocardia pulmonis]MCM6786931.1 helix-turn-helix domain-containing protein [Nocardia sp. CDC159]
MTGHAEGEEGRTVADGVSDGPSLSEKINYLFETVHPKDRGPWSHPEVHRMTGISIGTLSELRNGKNTNPTKQTMEKLARFFGVDAAYFLDTPKSAEIRQQLEQLKGLQALTVAMQGSEAESVLARISELSPSSLRALAEVVETLRGLEERSDI